MVQRANNQLRSLRVERSGDTVTATIKGSRGNGLQATGSVIILSLILALFTYGFGLLLIPLGIWFFAFARTNVVFTSDGVVTVGGKKLSIEDLHNFHVWGSQENTSGKTTFKRDVLAYRYGRRDYKIGVLPPEGEGFEIVEELQDILHTYKKANAEDDRPAKPTPTAPIESREQRF